jgi:hypothetical protein
MPAADCLQTCENMSLRIATPCPCFSSDSASRLAYPLRKSSFSSAVHTPLNRSDCSYQPPFLSSERLAMVDIAALPRETLRLIFHCLDPNARSSSTSDLIDCIQVCRLWHDLAVPLLYRQMWVYIPSPPAEEGIIRKPFSNPTSPNTHYERRTRLRCATTVR